MEMKTERTSKPIMLLVLTILVGIIYQSGSTFQSMGVPITAILIFETIWNAIFCGLLGYIFARETFLEQFKHFKFKTLLWGIPLTLIVGIGFSLIYNHLVGSATENSVGGVISLRMILFQIPFMLMGEELISTNVLIALEKMGLKFEYASIICSILFALWHIPAYGFVPLQLILTIVPTRLVLNLVWKKSNSIWVSWICHFIFDCIGFIQFFR